MKQVHRTVSLVFAGLLLATGFGCKPSAGGPGAPTPPPSSASPPSAEAAAKFVSVRTNSFNEVTSQLDPGGNFYLYLSTAQWLKGLSGSVSRLQSSVDALPQFKAEERANVAKAFDLVTRLIQDSGIEEATGIGISSIETEPGFYRNKFLLHHYPGQGEGFFWSLMGGKPHPFEGLNLLPANTALASFSDVDLPLLWSVISKEAAQSGFPTVQTAVQGFPAQFQKQTQVKWDQFLGSLGGEMGFILTLNESNRLTLPVPGASFEIPEPGIVIVLKVKDDTIFNRIDQELKSNPMVVSTDKAGLKMRTMPVPLPLPFDFRPTAASTGGYLLISSSEKWIEAVVAVQHGDQPGLKSTDEFKHLSQNLPDQGNHFTFFSERFGRAVSQIQTQAMKAAGAKNGSPDQSQWLQNLLSQKVACSYAVGANTENGYLITGNGTQSGASLALVPAAAVSGMLAAIAVPNFVKARARSQENACINNLRQLAAAKNEWALEKNKPTGAVPTKEDLLPYLKKWPVCPGGGTYTIGPAGKFPPTCSLPGHVLP